MEKGKSIPWKINPHTHTLASEFIYKQKWFHYAGSIKMQRFFMISISKFYGLYMQFSKYYVIKYELKELKKQIFTNFWFSKICPSDSIISEDESYKIDETADN